jgi:hypothetical protein
MQCPRKNGKASDLFICYVARTLDIEVEARLVRHLAECEDCRQAAQAQASVWSALDEWKPLPVSSDFNELLYGRIAAEELRPWYRRLASPTWNWKPMIPVGAAFAALVLSLILHSPQSSERPETVLRPEIDIQQIEQALDDIDMLSQLQVVAPTAKPKNPAERM